MEQRLELTMAVLERTPGALNALLRGLPEEWTDRSEGEGTWSVTGVLGHLIHAERADWMPRLRIVLEHGEGRTFDHFDRTAHERETPRRLGELLDEFREARTQALEDLRGLRLRPEDMARRGRHPALGVVTAGQLLATWAVHDLTHLHQISRIMAYQYRDAVGAWAQHLGVLQCEGHSK